MSTMDHVWTMSYFVFLITYYVFAAIVLMNLLIAMLSTTYSDITEESRAQWCFIFSVMVQEYSDSTVRPATMSCHLSTLLRISCLSPAQRPSERHPRHAAANSRTLNHVKTSF